MHKLSLFAALALLLALTSCATMQPAPLPALKEIMAPRCVPGTKISIPADWERASEATERKIFEFIVHKIKVERRTLCAAYAPVGAKDLPVLAVLRAENSADIRFLDLVLSGSDVSSGSIKQESLKREQDFFRLKVRDTSTNTVVVTQAFFSGGGVTVFCFALPGKDETKYEPLADQVATAFRSAIIQ